MTDAAYVPRGAACPACVGLPEGALERATASIPKTAELRRIVLSLPDIHCAACIDGVERHLATLPEVAASRVNLSLRRVTVTLNDPVMNAGEVADALTKTGFRALELDSATLAASGTDKEGKALLARLGVAGFATMNVMLLSVAVWSGAEDATRDLLHWISAAIAFPVIAFAGMPFFRSAFTSLRGGRLNMDVPITLAILLAAFLSLAEVRDGGHHAYFDAALTLTFFLLIGRYLDHRTRAAARSAATELAALDVLTATRIEGDTRKTVPVDALRPGDLLFVAPGARIPADGPIIEGRSDIDRAMLTGESLPDAAGPGDLVSAGMVNLTGPLTIRADALGDDTLLRQIARLVDAAEGAKNKYTRLADKAVSLYAPGVHILSAVSFLGWYIATGDLRTALNIAAAVLIITCPCALGLAVPSVQAAASGLLYRMGVLVKDGTALEKLAEVDHVVLDKTGTLTTDLPLYASGPNGEARHVAHALARASLHPLSRAIAVAYEGEQPAHVTDITEHPGEGLSGTYQNAPVRLGNARFTDAPDDGLWLRIGDTLHGFTFTHALRDGAAEMVQGLRDAGLPVTLLSGDTSEQTARIADTLGIPDWHACATPESKIALIERLTAEGRRVLMVGDGINDTAALAAAHVSMSPGSAAEASRSVADMVLVGQSITLVLRARKVAISSRKRIVENFQMASVYNVIAVPIAMAGYCSPLIAALAMSSSSICVTLNALRLRREPK